MGESTSGPARFKPDSYFNNELGRLLERAAAQGDPIAQELVRSRDLLATSALSTAPVEPSFFIRCAKCEGLDIPLHHPACPKRIPDA
jgi:hypothetical protein